MKNGEMVKQYNALYDDFLKIYIESGYLEEKWNRSE